MDCICRVRETTDIVPHELLVGSSFGVTDSAHRQWRLWAGEGMTLDAGRMGPSLLKSVEFARVTELIHIVKTRSLPVFDYCPMAVRTVDRNILVLDNQAFNTASVRLVFKVRIIRRRRRRGTFPLRASNIRK